MKKHQFIYPLSLLILILSAFAMLGDSQESTEQITEEPNPTEQSQTNQLSEEPNSTTQSSEASNPPESQFNILKDDFEMLQYSLDALKDSSDNSFWIFIIIIVVFIILISAFIIFWGRHLGQQQQEMLYNNQQEWQRKFNGNEQNWKEHLQLISRQSEESTQKLVEMESNQSMISNDLKKFDNTVDGIESRLEELTQTVTDLESARKINITPDNTVVYQVDVESIVQETQVQLEELVRAYRDGAPIDLDCIEIPIPNHSVVLNLNWIARTLKEWITELEQSTSVNHGLIQTLKYAEQPIKEKLKTIREKSMPALKSLNLQTDIELGNIRAQSITYLAQLEGVLIGYELGRKVDEVGSDEIIPHFIRNQLFNNVANHIPHDQLQKQLDRFLQLADYEVIPIEVGITEADSRFHEIQSSKQTGVKRGTVAEVISPGLMQKTDNFIVQKPVVIRGE